MARKVLVGRGIPENKITVILNVPDEQVYQRNRYNNAPNDGVFRLIQHGAMIESYGIQVVLQALKLSDPALPIHFDILGVGEYRPVLESMVCEMGLEDRVTFHGFVSRERLLELLHRANAGLVPMLFEYQSPSKMFEFVALGKPVIASDRETFRQHFGETEVFYFKTGDARDLAAAIETAFQNRKMMKDYANRATIRYGDYRWQKMKSHYLGLYTRLITELKPKLWILSG
jgi:glycosyltransferase involved in cell wall biosynthesis